MAWAAVQSKSSTGSTVTTVTVTLTGTPVVGNKIIVVTSWSSAAALTSMRDGNANNLTAAMTVTNLTNNTQTVFFYDVPATPSSAFTLVIGTASDTAVVVLEVSGLAAGNTTAAAVDGTPGSLTGTATPTGSPTYSSSATNEFLMSAYTDEGLVATATQPTGYTLDPNSVNASGIEDDCVAYINSTGGAEASSWSHGGTPHWCVITLAFKLSAGAAAVTSNAPAPPPWAPMLSRRLFRPPVYQPPYVRSRSTPPASLSLPLRGTFYYPWFTGGAVPGFPGAWDQGAVHPWTQYHPVRGYYDSVDTATIDAHIGDLLYGRFNFAISSWWGAGSREDTVLPRLLTRATALGTGFKWCAYYEPEGNVVAGIPGSPSPASAQLTNDLNYLSANYTSDPSYLHIGGKPVIFVYGGADDDSANTPVAANRPAARWSAAVAAASESWYYVLKVYDVWATDNATWPASNWHQYGPATAIDQQGTHSFTLSPGFWLESEHTPRLARDLPTFTANVRTMLASGTDFKLVTSFNEFGEGHPIEAVDGPSGTTGDYGGTGWTSNTGFGQYLDALHTNGQAPGLLATAGFTGARTALTRTARTATVGFTGASKTLTRALRTATLSFTGALGTILTGGGNHFTQGLSATVSFTGALPRQAGPKLTAVVGFTGAQARAVVHLLAATLAFTGSLAAGHRFSQILTAAFNFIGGAFGSAGSGGTPSLTAQTPGSGASAANQNITASATVGNKLILLYARSGGLATGAVTGITDTGGNSWSVVTRGAVSSVSNTRMEVWACNVTASPGTITVASGTAQTNAWNLLEYANVGAVDVASPDGSATTSSTTVTTPSITSTGSNDLILAAAHFGQTTAPLSSSSPWAALTNFDDAAVGSGRAAHILGAAAGSYAASWSPLGTAKAAGVVTVSLLSTGTGAATTGRLIITTNKLITAGVGFTAATLRNAVRKLVTATISFAGSVTNSGGTNHFTQALNATISFTGAMVRNVSVNRPASLSFTGATPRFVTKAPIAASVGFTGTTLRRLTRTLAASINFTGALPRTLNRSLVAAVSFTGALSRAPSRLLAASISFAGANTRRTSALRSGTLSFTGTSNTSTRTHLAAALSFTGSRTSQAVHHFTQALSATVGFTTSFATAAVHVFRTTLTATLSFTGSVVRGSIRTLAGSVGFTGAQPRRVGHVTTATVGFTGTESINLRRVLTATISFTGSTVRRLTRALAATIGFAGSLIANRLIFRLLTATVGFTTQFNRRFGKFLTATIGFTVTTANTIRTRLAAAIDFTVNYVITPHLLSALTGLLNRLRGREPTSVLSGTEPQQPISGHRPPTTISGSEPASRVLSGQRPATTISGEEDGT